MSTTTDARDLGVGLALAGARAGLIAGRLCLVPLRVAERLPLVGEPLRSGQRALAADGRASTARARVRLEELAAGLLSAPEFERTVDAACAGPLTDAIARSLAEHRVPERVAAQILASMDLDVLVDSVLEDERTDRLVAQVLDSRFTDRLTDRVLDSPELQRVVQHVAASPDVLAALSHHTETMAEEMIDEVRDRSQRVDDLAERTVRGWLRRPRPAAP